MKRTRLFLIRHGQVEGHEAKRYNGQKNVALTAHGRKQLDLVVERLEGVPLDAVWSSDLDRCRYGAERLADTAGAAGDYREGLRELHAGDWEGLTWEELQARYPAEWQARLDNIVNYRIPGGESFPDAAQRVRPELANCWRRTPGRTWRWSPTAESIASSCSMPSAPRWSGSSRWSRTTPV